MGYRNGLDKEAFLQYLFSEFPGVFDNPFAREMLENIVDYGMAHHTTSKNGLYYFLTDMIPEVEPKDLIPFMDKAMLTNEVLSLMDDVEAERQARVDFRPGFHCWGVFLDGVERYTVEVDSENFEGMNQEDLRDYVGTCVDAMRDEMEENGYCPFTNDDLAELENLMFDAWKEHFGIEDKTVVQTLGEMKGYLKDNGWEVSETFEGAWEIGRKAPGGSDWGVTVKHCGDVDRAIQALRGLAEMFDADVEAEVWAGEEGRLPLPSEVKDMVWIQEKLDELVADITTPFEREVDGLIEDAANRAVEQPAEREVCVVTFRKTSGAGLETFDVLLDVVPEDYREHGEDFSLTVVERQMAYEKALDVVGEEDISRYVIGSAKMSKVGTILERDGNSMEIFE